MQYTIVIGNKNYSSWSLRPWLVLDHFHLGYEEVMVPLDTPHTRDTLLSYTPAAKVPVLVSDKATVWDSLAIIEFLAEEHPAARIWPEDRRDRARARSLAAEMHSGFNALRGGCPMNLRKTFKFKLRGGPQARKDVDRFEQIVRDRMMRSGGPFLFGDWGAVDAMFTPLATRLINYAWPIEDETRAYCDALMGTDSFKKWQAAGVIETAILHADEVK